MKMNLENIRDRDLTSLLCVVLVPVPTLGSLSWIGILDMVLLDELVISENRILQN